MDSASHWEFFFISTEIYPFLKCNKGDVSRSESFPDAILPALVILFIIR